MKTILTRAVAVSTFALLVLLLAGQAVSPGYITIADASSTQSGLVSTGTQTFAGNKTFTGSITTSGAVNGNLTSGTATTISSYNGSTASGIWGGGVTPSTSNYSLLMQATTLVINAQSGQGLQFANGGVGQTNVDSSGNWQMASGATKTRGQITLSTGTGTATVLSGAICTCVDTTAANVVKCAVATTTLTATGTGSDVISYICL